MESKTVTIRVPADLHEQLKERARTEHTTVTELIQNAVTRDTRLGMPTPVADRFLAGARDAFADAFGTADEAGSRGHAAADEAGPRQNAAA